MKETLDTQEKKELAARIRRVRMDYELNQEQFAESLQVSRVYVNRIESPNMGKVPSRTLLRKICEIYEVDFKWLTTGEGEPHPLDEPETKPEQAFIEDIETNHVPFLISQTTDYINIKITQALNINDIPANKQIPYIQKFSILHRVMCQYMTDLKSSYKNDTEIPSEVIDGYIKQFSSLLNDKVNDL